MKKHKLISIATAIFAILRPSTCQYEEAQKVLDDMNVLYQSSSQRVGKFLLPPPNYKYPDISGYGEPHVELDEKFDFIIVGSGSSGAVIANRLSEVADWNILLLEVGEEASPLTDIPVLAPLFQFTNYNWNYLMEKQDNVCLGFVDQQMAWPRGRALGGTSIINYMIHVRGNKLDYNRWESMGNPGWSYKDLYKYFIKAEDAHIEKMDPKYHSTGGYLSVEDVSYRTQSVHSFVKAAQEAGHKYVDYNGRTQLGVSYVQSTSRYGRRWSVEAAYLRPIKNRKNLKILTKSRVIQVLINPDTQSAYGVRYIRNRQYHVARASKEVILSAGTFNSPQLLILSGIGPRNHLQELGIPIMEDLPVGQKLYDHLTFIGLVFTFDETLVNKTNIVNLQKELYNPINFIEYLKKGTGQLTSLGGVEALTYVKTNVSTEKGNLPDIELIFIGGGLHTDNGEFYRKTFRLTDEIYNAIWKPLENRFAFQILPMLLHPKSYGYLKLKSRNPYHWPKFYGNFFTDPQNIDIKTFIAGIRAAQKIIKQSALSKLGVQQVKTPIPGCGHHIFDTDDYWECALRHVSTTLHHQISTCKMGPSNDRESVVDSKLRVYGIKNLRVADCSVIPTTLSAHTNVPAITVGEKASDLIKNDWLGNPSQQLSPDDIRRKKET